MPSIQRLQMEFNYDGYAGPAKCDLLLESGTDRVLATISERDDNLGTSITNAIETIATQVMTAMPGGDPDKVVWVERYPQTIESFTLVRLKWDDRKARLPRWQHLGVEGYSRLRDKLGVVSADG